MKYEEKFEYNRNIIEIKSNKLLLTKRQNDVLNFVRNHENQMGYAPSLNEIKSHLEISSVSTAHYHVKNLIRSGYLMKDGHRFSSPYVQVRDFQSTSRESLVQDSYSVPIYGTANAGIATVFAEENLEGYIKLPSGFRLKRQNVFALRVKGDSMNLARIDEKNIEDGDYALVDPNCRNPKNGDYILSIIDGFANIKKFERNNENGTIRLISESTNLNHKPIYISSEDDYMVNGKIIAMLKK